MGFGDQFGERFFELIVGFPLWIRHFDKIVVIGAWRQIFEHFIAGAAQDVGSDQSTQLIQVFVTEHLVGAIGTFFQFVELVVEVPERAKDARVEKLEDAVEFVDAIFERRAGQNESIAAGQGFDHLSGLGAPVFDALGLIQDDQIGPKFEQFVLITTDQVRS